MTAYQDLCAAISKEVAHYGRAGASLTWGSSRRVGEAIIRLADQERRVVFPRSPSRYDKANTIGRVRRALRMVGVLDVATPVAVEIPPKKKRPSQGDRIAILEARLNDALDRIEALERSLGCPMRTSPDARAA